MAAPHIAVKETCDNNVTVSRQEIEARVLGGLKEKLLAPDLVREFIRAFQEEMNTPTRSAQNSLSWSGLCRPIIVRPSVAHLQQTESPFGATLNAFIDSVGQKQTSRNVANMEMLPLSGK